MTRSHLAVPRLMLAVAAAVSVIGCHRTPRAGSLNPNLEGVIGDTSAFGPRILRLDRAQQRVTYSLTEPAYVVILTVAPGRAIDPVWVDPRSSPSMIPAEQHTASLWMQGAVRQRVATGTASNEPPPIEIQAEIDRCVRQRVAEAERRAAAAERARRPAAPVARDSAGRPNGRAEETGPPPGMLLDADFERRAEAECTRAHAKRPRRPTAPDTDDRYIVLLASSVPIDQAQLLARLDGLTVTAPDARGTIAAVAEGLYFDRGGTWAGYYVRWR